MNERSLMITLLFLLAGVVLGMVLNWEATRMGGPIPWSDPTLWTSTLLLVWNVAVLSFVISYRPARRGRKVAYLTIASFICLIGVLSIILLSPSSHARRVESRPAAASLWKGLIGMSWRMVGCSHRTCPLDLRERLVDLGTQCTAFFDGISQPISRK